MPDNFKNADGSFISIPHNFEVVSEAEEKQRKLAAPVQPAPCNGTGASTMSTITANGVNMQFNYNTNPSFTPMPASVADFATLVTSVTEALTTSTSSVCMYLDVNVGSQGLNWDTTTNKVQSAVIDMSEGDSLGMQCNNCYAVLGGAITYKASCDINSTNPGQSACTVQMYIGGGVKFNVDMLVTKINLAGSAVNKPVITGTKTQVFYDPTTSITISVTPAMTVGFQGTAVSTGTLTLTTSLDSSVSVGTTFTAPAGTLDVGFGGDITLQPPQITSNFNMSTYDLTFSVQPTLLWTIGAGQMVTATYLTAPIPSSDVAATGMAVQINMPNPMTFSWQFTKAADAISSKASATLGFAVSNMNAFLAANWYYTGSTATIANPAALYDYSKWPVSDVGINDIEYNWPLYTSAAAATTVALGADVPGAVSLNTPSTPPAPGPAPAPAPGPGNTNSNESTSSGMSGGETAGLIIGLIIAGALGYYAYSLYKRKQETDNDAYTGLNAGLDVKH